MDWCGSGVTTARSRPWHAWLACWMRSRGHRKRCCWRQSRRYEVDVARVRAVLGDAAFTAAREAGRGLSLESAVTEALALADTLSGV